MSNKIVISALVASVSLVFIAGYSVGTLSWARSYLGHTKQQAFNDELYASLLTLYEKDPLDLDQEESKAAEQEGDSPVIGDVQQQQEQPLYYAELIGYKSLRSANEYVEKLQQQDIPVRVVKRVSSKKSKKNKNQVRKIVWYQVITNDMDRQTLEEIVEGLQKHDKLTGVKIKRRESRSKERLTS